MVEEVAGSGPRTIIRPDVVYTSSFGGDVKLSIPGYFLALAIWVTSLATLHGGSHREKIRLVCDGLHYTFVTSSSLLKFTLRS